MRYSATKKTARKATMSANRAIKQEVTKQIANYSEKKAIQSYLPVTDLATAGGGVLLLNGCSEGDTIASRDGRLIFMKDLSLNVAINADNATTGANIYGYWAVVLDRQANNTDVAQTDVWDVSTVIDPILAPRNTEGYARYKVLLRKDFNMLASSSNPTASFASPQQFWREYIDLTKLGLKDSKVRYSSSGATIGSLVTNSLFLVWNVSTQADMAPSAGDFAITAGAKVGYTDA